ncbi:hypothetical protein BH11PSE11_BH11PSE11_06810 [soil metagenome]
MHSATNLDVRRPEKSPDMNFRAQKNMCENAIFSAVFMKISRGLVVKLIASVD